MERVLRIEENTSKSFDRRSWEDKAHYQNQFSARHTTLADECE